MYAQFFTHFRYRSKYCSRFFQETIIIQILVASFLGVLFMESGTDKIFDWRGNMEFLKGHFDETGFRELVPFLLGVVALVELAAGLLSSLGVIQLIFYADNTYAFYGAAVSALALIMLFFGQRIAKDYKGAATLATYFLLTLVGMFLLNY